MIDNPNIFNPKDNSLEEKINAYKNVYKAYLNAEASVSFAEDEEWEYTLGEEEIEEAYKIMADSLKVATSKISTDEMQQAKEQGLINKHELFEFIQDKRQQEIKSSRQTKQNSTSNKHQQ